MSTVLAAGRDTIISTFPEAWQGQEGTIFIFQWTLVLADLRGVQQTQQREQGKSETTRGEQQGVGSALELEAEWDIEIKFELRGITNVNTRYAPSFNTEVSAGKAGNRDVDRRQERDT